MAKKRKAAKKTNGARVAKMAGAGALAAAALAMAGGYVLWERMGKERQAKVKTWVGKARKEAAKNVAKAKRMSEVEYRRIVERAVKHYGSLSDANKAELAKAAADMKAEWKRIKSEAKVMAKEMQGKGKAPTAKRPRR